MSASHHTESNDSVDIGVNIAPCFISIRLSFFLITPYMVSYVPQKKDAIQYSEVLERTFIFYLI